MPQRRAIPESPELYSRIMVLVAEGKGNVEIANWLTCQLGRRVDRKQVGRVINDVRETRAVEVRRKLQDEAGKTAVADLSAIGRMLSDAHEIQCAAMSTDEKGRKRKGSPMVALRAIDTQKRLIELRYALLGVGKLPGRDGDAPKGSIVVLPPEEGGT